jgi:hypothetical protein
MGSHTQVVVAVAAPTLVEMQWLVARAVVAMAALILLQRIQVRRIRAVVVAAGALIAKQLSVHLAALALS